MFGEPAIGSFESPAVPSVSVQIGKVGNGYTVHLQSRPERPRHPVRPRPEGPFQDLDPDQAIDKMVDGLGALIRSINDKGAGEDWKNDEDRQAIREVVKAIFPSVAGHPHGPPVYDYETMEQAKSEHLVFQEKSDLIAYLEKNL